MGLIRLWRRQLVSASAATLLFPAVLLSLALGVAGTRLGGLGSLRELVAGPEMVEPAALLAPRPSRGSQVPLPAVPAASPSLAGRAAGAGAGTGSVGGATRGARADGQGGRSGAPTSRGPGSGTRPQRPGGPPSASASPNPGAGSSPPGHPAPPASGAGPVQSGVHSVQQTAGSLPAPVGPAASDAVGTVSELVGPGRR